MNVQFRPLVKWPRPLTPAPRRKASGFKADVRDTLKILSRELDAVSAVSPMVQVAVHEAQISGRTGLPYAEAEPQHPGVLLAFTRNGQPYVFPCDAFPTWQENLRAIALGLEALRKVDRYGITARAEQYTGFKALPPPGPGHADIQTVEDAARWMGRFVGAPLASNRILVDPEPYRSTYRALAAKFHPDAGGDPADWAKLQAAKTLLDDHHGKAVPGA